jgi:sugar lactone lactonase YvrE
MPSRFLARLALVVAVAVSIACPAVAQQAAKTQWLQAKAYALPKETTSEGSGYFSIVEGHNGKLYVGTAKYRENCFLVEFDPKTEAMKVVVDAHKEIGTDLKGFAAQAKFHTRNNIGASGKIYAATKQGYPNKEEKRTDYPGGYPIIYDPATGQSKVYPIPIAHQGIISITPDESRGVAYLSTCDDNRPIESTHFMILDLESGKYRDLLDCQHMYAFIVVDYKGRAYHPILGGDISRYDPAGDRLQRLKQTIDGVSPTPESKLADPNSHPINWDISPDGKTLYAVAMSTNQLYSYDLTAEGDTLPGRSLGPLAPGAERTDCRGMCVGKTGQVWAAVTAKTPLGDSIQHVVSYRPGDKAPRNHGPVAISNPSFTEFTDKEGKLLPHHGGFRTMADGAFTTKYVILGVCQGSDGSVYALALQPYTLIRIPPEQLR